MIDCDGFIDDYSFDIPSIFYVLWIQVQFFFFFWLDLYYNFHTYIYGLFLIFQEFTG